MSLAERLFRFMRKRLPEKRLAIQATLRSLSVRLVSISRHVRLMTLAERQLRRQLFGTADADAQRPPRPASISASPLAQSGTKCIPRRIFQTWKSKTEFPTKFSYWTATFDAMNPDFEHIIWDDTDNRSFISEYYSWFLPIYDSYPREIYRADAIRYFFLYSFGGIYADMDAECLRPLHRLLGRGDVLLGRMGSDPRHPHSIPNATMASRPRQEFWLWVIWMIIFAVRQAPPTRPEYATGPVVLKSAVDLYLAAESRLIPGLRVRSAIQMIANLLPPDLRPEPKRSHLNLLPSQEWFPIDWTQPLDKELIREIFRHGLLDEKTKRERFSDSSVISYWSCSWEENLLNLEECQSA